MGTDLTVVYKILIREPANTELRAQSKETPGYTLVGGRMLSGPKRLNYSKRNWTKSWGEAHEGYNAALSRAGEQGTDREVSLLCPQR